ncbi:hypothetical protein DL764_002594 [Monosporascus ibericus]|uniref:Uncharacterized protein n=1 Tax=Monosporascus ibericus TaxID=155417 RepID=A0A4V1XBS6_9PEZI|nr:hypothetical protein DL764_002594 [Monosporascus ibericus]
MPLFRSRSISAIRLYKIILSSLTLILFALNYQSYRNGEDIRDCLAGDRMVFVRDSTIRQIFRAAAEKLRDVNTDDGIGDAVDLGAHGDIWVEVAEDHEIPEHSDKPAGLLVMGTPGLSAAHHGGDDYLELFKSGIEHISGGLLTSLDDSDDYDVGGDDDAAAAARRRPSLLAQSEDDGGSRGSDWKKLLLPIVLVRALSPRRRLRRRGRGPEGPGRTAAPGALGRELGVLLTKAEKTIIESFGKIKRAVHQLRDQFPLRMHRLYCGMSGGTTLF